MENKMQQHEQWGGNVFGVSLNTNTNYHCKHKLYKTQTPHSQMQ